MTIDQFLIPAAVVAAIAVLVVLSLRSPRGMGAGRRGEAQLLAAVQAERDVLRANHAVEIVALERRLAAAMKRTPSGDDGSFRPEAAERAAAVARHDHAAQELVRKELSGRLAHLAAERDQFAERARQAAQLLVERDRARAEAAGAADESARLRAELADAAQRLSRVAAERDRIIAQVEGAAGGDADTERLGTALAAAAERERAANDSLSRLAYDRDGLTSRLAGLERAESEAKAEVEKREALLELRQQKIYDLESRLRDATTALRETQQSLAAAGERPEKGGGGNGAMPPEDPRRLDRLQTKLDRVWEENATLLKELDGLRRRATEAGDDDGGGLFVNEADDFLTADAEAARAEAEAARADAAAARAETSTARRDAEAARSEVARIAAENRRLADAAAAPRADEAELERLRAELRTLAERFATETEALAPPAQPAEPTLAERIRAFKTKRGAGAPPGPPPG